MKKFYAVRKGRKTGIFTSWDDCESVIKGFGGAEYKGFNNEEDARRYLENDIVIEYNNCLVASSTKVIEDKTSFGVSIQTSKGVFDFMGKTKYSDTENAINDTIVGVLIGLELAVDMQERSISILYNYDGIKKWITGDWKTKNEISRAYKDVVYKLVADYELELNFIKADDKICRSLMNRSSKLKASGNFSVNANKIFSGSLKVSDLPSSDVVLHPSLFTQI